MDQTKTSSVTIIGSETSFIKKKICLKSNEVVLNHQIHLQQLKIDSIKISFSFVFI